MDTIWAQWIVMALGVYAGVGLVLAIPFVAFGVSRVDRSAHGAPILFRLLILPGAVALWPIVARWWLSGRGEPPEESNAHRRAARR